METHPTTLQFYRRKLPHWLVANATYFITIRLQGSLPRNVLADLADERAKLKADGAGSKQWQEYERREFARIEKILDTCRADNAWLALPDVARMVIDSLHWLEDRGWDVFAAVVMSNHVHILCRNSKGRSSRLLSDLGLFKNFTGRCANHILGRSGSFWAREDFDHWLRDVRKLESVIHYIADNPAKAGLVKRRRDWPWLYLNATAVDIVGQYAATS